MKSSVEIVKNIGSTGHPYLSGSRTGDYWLFKSSSSTDAAPAGSRFNINFITRSAKTAARYWSLEYLDGTEWKPAAEQRTVEVEGEGTILYTLDLVEDLMGNKKLGTDNAQIDNDFTLTDPVPAGGFVQCRLRCVANVACDGTAVNAGNNRIAGAVGTSPVISALEAE